MRLSPVEPPPAQQAHQVYEAFRHPRRNPQMVRIAAILARPRQQVRDAVEAKPSDDEQ
jgi:hypothetical protein